MPDSSVENKRIAKNTILLYFRTILTMLVSLYTSRVVLDVLGVDDYGVYSVVGGVVSMFSIISGALNTAISRYLSFGIGRNDFQSLRKTFSTSIIVQITIAIIVLILCEVVGVWFLNNKLSIPSGRMYASNWVLQCSLITFVVNLVNVPFNSLIISHERMNVYAYISIYEVVMKLVIVYLLLISSFDKLISYAVLTLVVSLSVIAINTFYCLKSFPESRGKLSFDRFIFKEMLSFAGWNFFSNGIFIFNTQGVSILVNLYFGVAVNAARGVATQVNTAVTQFVTNFTTAINPQITKSYAAGDINRTFYLVCKGAKYSFFLLLIFAAPLIAETEFVLNVWLKEVPDHVPAFIRLVLVCSLIGGLGNSGYTACLASGKIKKYVIVVSSFCSLDFFLTWIVYALGAQPEATYYVYAVVYAFLLLIRLQFMKRMLGFNPNMFYKEVIARVIPVAIISFVVPVLFARLMDVSFRRFLFTCLLSVITTCGTIYFIGLKDGEKHLILQTLRNYLKKLSK